MSRPARGLAALLPALAALLLLLVPDPPAPAAPLGQAGSPAAEATPPLPALGGPFPEGVSLRLLAAATLPDPPAGEAVLRLDRLELAPGATLAGTTGGGALLLAVESGEIEAAAPTAAAGRYGAGGQLAVPTGTDYELTNVGAAPAALLRLRLEPVGASPSPTAAEASLPTRPVTAATPEATTAQVLLAETVRLPRGEAQLLLAEVAWEAGATTGDRIYPGPVGLVVAEGELTARGPTGTPVRLEPGGGILAPAYTAHEVRAGAEPATALAVALLPAEAPRAGGFLPSPTPDFPATARVAADAAAATIAALGEREASAAAMAAAAATEAAAGAGARATLAAEATAAGGSAAATVERLAAARRQAESSLGTARAAAESAAATTTALAGERASAAGSATAGAAARATGAAELASLAAAATQAAEAATGAEATIAAQVVAASDAGATATAAADRAGRAAATIETDRRQAQTAAVALATAQARLTDALGTANVGATAAAATSAAAESARATAAADAASLATAAAGVAADATAAALEAGVAQGALSATVAAQATQGSAAAVAATETIAQVAAGQATVAAQQAALADLAGSATAAAGAAGSALATAAADATAAEATIAAVTGGGVAPEPVELSIQTDLVGVLTENPAAVETAREGLRRVLTPYARAECRAGVVLTFGHAGDVGSGADLAAAVNELLPVEFPDLFANAAFDNLADLNPPPGQVDLRIYFFGGCAPAQGAAPAAETPTAIRRVEPAPGEAAEATETPAIVPVEDD